MKLGKAYEPGQFESDIYALWEKSGVFAPTGKGAPFAMVMPPPNANASLHIGHSLNYSLMDIVARYRRLRGDAVLMLPGADHAGFETQVVYEKHLAKEGKSRFDFTREELYSRIWDFVQENKGTFESQLRNLGVSCDWSRFTFTLDDKIINTAYKTFKKMWDDGLIYRGERLVNYCTFHRTGFADIEVQYEEKESPLYYLKYGPFTLATTRPETKFGDTAIAVHPDDERYKKYIGQVIKAEGVNGPFEIRVVGDEYVDPNFGTGVVKITPAHDFNDWEVAQRHNLEAIRVMNHDGTMNHRAGRFEGMTVLEAREAVVKALEEKGLLEKIDKHYRNRIGVCYKCGTAIEPMLLDQWFVDMKKLAAPAIKALKAKKVAFYPAAKREQTITYLENVRDWNISRQIAWGIPIPAFQNLEDSDDWIFDERVSEEIIEVDGKKYRRDPDVFDTWFSSGQWPFATLGYPEGDDFKRFYPTALMETGTDILYQWVARMLCLGLYVTGEVPFRDVYLHGMVRSEDGRKMSKSLGNVVDPHGLIEHYGSDALRMGIISGRSAGYSAAYAPAKLVAGRNFANKLWNIARFIESKTGDNPKLKSQPDPKTSADYWILTKLQQSSDQICALLDEYRFSEAYELLYHLIWDDVADWYIEASKGEVDAEQLAFVLEACLVMAHPFAPFVTETIWQTLAWEKDNLLASRTWPKISHTSSGKAADFEEVKAIATEIHEITGALELKNTRLYHSGDQFIRDNSQLIATLAHIKEINEVEDGNGMHLISTKRNCWLDIDRDTAKHYLGKLEIRASEQQALADRLNARLDNKNYVNNAPHEVVSETREQLKLVEDTISAIKAQQKRFSGLRP